MTATLDNSKKLPNLDPYAYLDKLSITDLIHLYDHTPSMPLKSTISAKITAKQLELSLRKRG